MVSTSCQSIYRSEHLRVVPEEAGLVIGNIVAALGLIDANLARRRHIVEVLIRVDTSLLWCRPASCVDTCCALAGVILLHPVSEKCDCILGSRVAAKSCRDTLCCATHNTDGLVIWDHRLVDVDVMRVEVVRDVAILAGPGLEGLKLALRLAHVRVEVVEVAELLSPESCIRVGRVVAFVVFDVNKDVVLFRLLQKLLVMLEQLDSWLRNQDVDAALDGVQSDRVVSGVRCENGDFVWSAASSQF